MLEEHDVDILDSHFGGFIGLPVHGCWKRIKTALVELGTTPNKQSTPLVCDVCNCLSTPTNEVHPVNICFKCYEDAH
jgi:hypothetical protein